MAYPTVRSRALVTVTSNSTSWTLDYDALTIEDGGTARTQAGDLILISIGRDGIAGTGAITGYATIFDSAASTTAKGLTFAKIATGTESGTFTYSPGANEQGVVRIVVFKHVYGSVTIGTGLSVSSAATSTDTAPDPNSCTAAWGSGVDTHWRAFAAHDSGLRSITAYPSGFTIYQNSDASGGGTGAGLGSCGLESQTSPQDAGAFTLDSSDEWVAWTIAIRPGLAITGSTIASSATIYAATVAGTAGSQSITTDTIATSETLYAATVTPGPVAITTDTIASGETLFAATVGFATQTVTLPTIGGSELTDAFDTTPFGGRWVNVQNFGSWAAGEVTTTLDNGDIKAYYDQSLAFEAEAQLTTQASSGPTAGGPGVRIQTSDGSGYGCYVASDGSVSIFQFYSGGKLEVATAGAGTVTLSSNNWLTVRLKATGANGGNVTLNMWVTNHGATKPSVAPDWITSTQVVTDAVDSTGSRYDDSAINLYAGVLTNVTGTVIDYWRGRDVNVTAASVVYAATVTPGAVALTLPTIAAGTTLYEPTVAPGPVTVTTATLAASSTLYAPTVSSDSLALTLATIVATAAIYGVTTGIEQTIYLP